ncbi:MAG: crotonobetainyl-CoA:carnitine CoA-transferase CaiB-like acyl-CoA transferase [Acidimicrobiales bacterium]|jgi:crotonobetainyl-CoA:carnitine CoA-transferase CaiB-like acyl-CoA transferase
MDGDQSHEATGPLRGKRVIDLGTLLAGPVAATLLGDFGAEVIKVEQPGVGDTLRGGVVADGQPPRMAWLVEGRNKRSVTINLRTPEGQELVRKLVATADIVVENFTPGTLEGWGLGWDDLQAVNPKLIMVRVSGFGQTGPYSERAGYDRIALGVSGYLYPTGYPDRPPVRPAFPTADYNTATFAALAAMFALYERDAQGGAGQMIDLALYEAPFRITADLIGTFRQRGELRERIGNRNPGFTPAGNFLTSDDRWIQIAAGGDRPWRRLCEAMGVPELADDERYLTSRDRHGRADELEELLRQWVATVPFDELEDLLAEHNVPAGGILTAADISDHPQFEARGNIAIVDDGHGNDVSMPSPTPNLVGTPGTIRHAGQDLGLETEAILSELGLDASDVADLRDKGIV